MLKIDSIETMPKSALGQIPRDFFLMLIILFKVERKSLEKVSIFICASLFWRFSAIRLYNSISMKCAFCLLTFEKCNKNVTIISIYIVNENDGLSLDVHFSESISISLFFISE